MIGLLSKIFGGKKSDKDVLRIQPIVAEINRYFEEFSSLTNDELRNKTQEFRQRIADHLGAIDTELTTARADAEAHTELDVHAKEAAYAAIDKLVKTRDEKIEEILREIHAEAFAVVKEMARRLAQRPFGRRVWDVGVEGRSGRGLWGGMIGHSVPVLSASVDLHKLERPLRPSRVRLRR